MTITVSGRGRVPVAHDAAELHLGLEYPADTVADALAGAQSAQAQAMEVLARDAATAQVSSEGLRIHPDHRRDGDGFVASHTLRVSGLAIADAGDLVQHLAEVVGDRLRLYGLSLIATDTGAAEDRARELAVADARRRAEQLAALTGGALGEVLSVRDGADGADQPVPLADAMSRGSIEAGEVEIDQAVTITWRLVSTA